MHSRLTQYYMSPTIRHYVRVVTVVVLGASIATLMVIDLGQRGQRTENTDLGSTDAPQNAYVLSGSKPVRLTIPSINVDALFEEPLGLNADQGIEVPDSFDSVGWYEHGPTPGELGPAVVLGHVDSVSGPAVFYSLGQLTPGDTIAITREDGSVAVFRVTGLARYEQEGFPTELVYGDLDHAGLRLVTCSGIYDRGAQRYSHNLVVYAALIESSAVDGSE